MESREGIGITSIGLTLHIPNFVVILSDDLPWKTLGHQEAEIEKEFRPTGTVEDFPKRALIYGETESNNGHDRKKP